MTSETTSAKPPAANPNSAVAICIPARLESSRLPRKLLLAETGKPLIQHTFENAARSKIAAGYPPLVITDNAEIALAVLEFGGYIHVGPPAGSGTERIARYAKHSTAQIIVNVQGDEPEIEPEAIDAVAELLAINPDCSVATLATPIRSFAECCMASVVKVACDYGGRAMYFSRSMIPFSMIDMSEPFGESRDYLRHIGIYAIRREALIEFAKIPQTPLELRENLEQLRWLETGYKVAVGIVDQHAKGIDTPEDYREFVKRQRPSQAESSQSPDSSIKELCE